MTEDLQSIISRAQKGDREAFRQLLRMHYGMIHRVSYRFTGQMQDAEDVTQEVCMQLVDKLGSYKGTSSFSTWLYRVVVNQTRDFHKKRKADRTRDTRYIEIEAMEAADMRDEQKKAAWLYRAIAALKPPLPETAMLVLGEQLSHAQAGAILGCKEATVSWRMSEVRKHLTQAMDGYHD